MIINLIYSNKIFLNILLIIFNLLKFLKFNILNIKNFCNLYLIFSVFIYIVNLLLKIFFNDLYKYLKFYKYILLNFIFFILITYLLELNINLSLWLSNIYIKLGSDKVTVLSIIFSLIWISVTLFISIYNNILFEIIFSDIEEIDLNLRLFLFRFFNSLIFFSILITGFVFMNLDTFLLSIFGGAFSLGLSVSVQKTVSNYISSLLILSDKSFKIGDAININGYQGVITQISNRYVMLRNLDCSEILVPNEKFINDIIQNQSLYFSKGNLRTSIQISYNNDVILVLRLLEKSTVGVERVLENPISIAYFNGFSIDGIDLELSFWIIDAVRGAGLVRSEVNINIWKLIKEHNIELSYYKRFLKILN